MAPLINDSDDDLSCTCAENYSCGLVGTTYREPLKPPMMSCSQEDVSASLVVEVKKSDDPFLYYSNDETRMRALRLIDDDSVEQRQAVRQRKTRISFEVHPSLFLDEIMFDDLSYDGVDDLDLDFDLNLDNNETDLTSSADTAELLRQLLEI